MVEVEHELAGQHLNTYERPDPAAIRHGRPTAEQADGELRADAVRERLEAEGYKPPKPRPPKGRGRGGYHPVPAGAVR